LYIFSEAAADQRDRGFSRTESWNACNARKIASYFFGRFGYVLGWNF
jgi:hypothetical protein